MRSSKLQQSKRKEKQHRDLTIQVMVTHDQKEKIEAAALKKGLSASTWALMHLLPLAEEISKES